MKFKRLKLLLELNPEEIKIAHEYASKRKEGLSFGLFKEPRTYYLLKETNVDLVVPKDILNFLDSLGFYCPNYLEGIAYKKDDTSKSRPFKLGKILSNESYLKKLFDERLNEEADANISNNAFVPLMIVISHHPEDIVGMSTDRLWSSCVNIRIGSHSRDPYMQVQYGGMVAYLTSINDKEIEKPYARIAIKIFINENDFNYFMFIHEPKIYGIKDLAKKLKMEKFIDDQLQKSNNLTIKKGTGTIDIYKVDDFCYLDILDGQQIKIQNPNLISNEELKKAIESYPYLVKDIDNLLDKKLQLELQLIAVSQDGHAIRFIKDPDKDVQLESVRNAGYAIQWIKDPDKDVQMTAVKQFGHAIRFIDNPDKDVQLAAVRQNGNAIKFICDKGIIPDKEVQLEAVRQTGLAIAHIKNPDKDVQLEAVRQNGLSIEFIKNPDKEIIETVKK